MKRGRREYRSTARGSADAANKCRKAALQAAMPTRTRAACATPPARARVVVRGAVIAAVRVGKGGGGSKRLRARRRATPNVTASQ